MTLVGEWVNTCIRFDSQACFEQPSSMEFDSTKVLLFSVILWFCFYEIYALSDRLEFKIICLGVFRSLPPFFTQGLPPPTLSLPTPPASSASPHPPSPPLAELTESREIG